MGWFTKVLGLEKKPQIVIPPPPPAPPPPPDNYDSTNADADLEDKEREELLKRRGKGGLRIPRKDRAGGAAAGGGASTSTGTNI